MMPCPLTRVRFEPVRSAEPPSNSGVAGIRVSNTFWPDCRVAIFGLLSAISCFSTATASPQLSGSFPDIARSKSARWFDVARRLSQARRVPAERSPAVCHIAVRSSGTVNGGAVQPSNCFAAAASAGPSGEPCVPAVPALVGAPRPMMVRQAMSVGLRDRMEADNAAVT